MSNLSKQNRLNCHGTYLETNRTLTLVPTATVNSTFKDFDLPRIRAAISGSADLPVIPKESHGRTITLLTEDLGLVRNKGGRFIFNGENNSKNSTLPIFGQSLGDERHAVPHLHLDPQLELEILPERQKYLGVLGHDAAENEYQIRMKISNGSALCFPPISVDMWCKGTTALRTPDNKVAGALTYKFEPDYCDYGANSFFTYIEDRSGQISYFGSSIPEPLVTICHQYQLAGYYKGKLAEEFLIAQHVSHLSNFQFNPITNDLKVADFDTSIDLEKMDPNTWGPQLLRDLAMELFRVSADFALATDTPKMRQLSCTNGINPFGAFLTGFFDGKLEQSKIDQFAQEIFESYLELTNRRSHDIQTVKIELGQLFTETNRYDLTGNANTEIRLIMINLLPTLLDVSYQALLASSYQKRGFTLPEFSSTERRQTHFNHLAAIFIYRFTEHWQNFISHDD